MSLFGTSPTEPSQAPSTPSRSRSGRGGNGLFDDQARPSSGQGGGGSSSLFADDAPDSSGHDDSPWDMPTPRKQESRAELIRRLLPASDVPDSYIEAFDKVVREDGGDGRVGAAGVANVFASARLGSDAQKRIMTLVSAGSNPSEATLGRSEFNVLLALVGLAQEGDVINLDGVDERRRSKYFLFLAVYLSIVISTLGWHLHQGSCKLLVHSLQWFIIETRDLILCQICLLLLPYLGPWTLPDKGLEDGPAPLPPACGTTMPA